MEIMDIESTTTRTIVEDSSGAPYNQIDISLELTPEGAIGLSDVNDEDSPTVDFKPSDLNHDAALQIIVYCPRTKILIQPPEGTKLQNSETMGKSEGISFEATAVDGSLTIDARNENHVDSASSKQSEPEFEISLTVTLEVTEEPQQRLQITLVAPPYRLVGVDFSLVNGEPEFTYSGDVDEMGTLWMPQEGGIVFSLTETSGAEFDPSDPIVFQDPLDGIIDIGSDGRLAFMADLYTGDVGPPNASTEEFGHYFNLQVIYNETLYPSDPTIVNVEPTDPPEAPEPLVEG